LFGVFLRSAEASKSNERMGALDFSVAFAGISVYALTTIASAPREDTKHKAITVRDAAEISPERVITMDEDDL